VNATKTTTEAEIWGRAIRPDQGDFSPAEARAVLRWRLAEADVQRVKELSARAREGALSAEESDELDNYLNVGSALEFLKAKARLSLRQNRLAA
jgi:hypothetical protein